MVKYGYKLMCEEHAPVDLVRNARRAEEAGFEFVAISDHFHPWLADQGHAAFAWTVLGAIAAKTERIGLVTAVTCPTLRYHPAIVAQFAATLAILSGGRFTLGLGSGENLNEHVVGLGWPTPSARQAMLGEAIDIILALWKGHDVTLAGDSFSVERAKLWDVPGTPPPIAVAAGGPNAARLAAEKGAGLFATEPRRDLVEAWSKAGGKGPRYCEVMLSWARDEATAIATAHSRSRFAMLGWKVMSELPTPASFAAAAEWVRKEDVAKSVPCGPDPARHLAAIQPFIEVGFDHVVLNGTGPDQEGFLRFFEKELAPRLPRD